MEKTMKSKLVDYLLKGAFSAALFFCVSLEKADAGLIKLVAEGRVGSPITEAGFEFDGSFKFGDPMIGYCIYDEYSPDLWPTYPGGSYELEEVGLSFGNYNFIHNPNSSEKPHMYIDNAPWVQTGYDAHSFDPYSNDIFYLNGEEKNFSDFNWDCFGMDVLYIKNDKHIDIPETLPIDSFPSLEDFVIRWMELEHDAYPNFSVRGYIDNITLTRIPEPSTIALLGLGSLVLIRRVRE
ncbi:MAG: PEP-CTERM sorting domain-containing protein [Planctomycetota bacterium]|jgi:hypothetical protein